VTFASRIAALIVTLGAVTAPAVPAQAPGAGPAGQPALTVLCSTSPAPVFKVTITNPGQRPRSLLLGYTPGSAQPQVATALTVAVIRIATGATEEYVYVHPKYATYAGRKDPWIVPLNGGASFDLELPLRDFISSMNYNSLEPGTAVGGRLILDARAAPRAPAGFWTGKIEATIDACG
jgi:hypothetical protein